jgi:signal peptidase
MSRLDVSTRHLVLTFVVFLVVSPFAAYAVPAVVGADESYIVLTGSMQPTYAPGDVVFVAATPAAQIAAGDVITFQRGPGPTTTHRVIDVVEASGEVAFQTKGDNNEDPDPALVRADQVVGVVTLSIPYLGTVITAADTQYGFLALVVLPFGLLVLDVLYGAVRGRRDTGAAALDESDVPVVYDPVVAARAYYEQAAAMRAEANTPDTQALTGRDMTAAITITTVLLAYAVWNAYWQFTALGQPRPETMSIVSGALVGLAFLVYLRVTGGSEPSTAAPDSTDAAAAAPTDGARPASEQFVPAGAPAHTARAEEVYDAD